MWWDNRQSTYGTTGHSEDMGLRDLRKSTVLDDGKEAYGVSSIGWGLRMQEECNWLKNATCAGNECETLVFKYSRTCKITPFFLLRSTVVPYS